MPNSPDDLEGLKAERAAADREYNDALTRLDAVVQARPASLPHPPPGPDHFQITPLNTLWTIAVPPPAPGLRGRVAAAVRRIVAPLFDRQQAFNAAVVDHVNRNVPVQEQTRQAIDAVVAVLRDEIADRARFHTLLIVFLQQITPYVDTRDRDVAGLLRGLSGAINAVSDELLKRSEGLLARDLRREGQLLDAERALAALQRQTAALQRLVDELASSRRA